MSVPQSHSSVLLPPSPVSPGTGSDRRLCRIDVPDVNVSEETTITVDVGHCDLAQRKRVDRRSHETIPKRPPLALAGCSPHT